MYMEGVLPTGELMTGTVVGDVKLRGDQVICAACHRRSGLGSMEGQEAVPAVTGDLLFQPLRLPTSKPPLAPVLRPAYDAELLKRAIRDGVRSDGQPLGELMPRYDLSDEQLGSLIAYLDSLQSSSAPGVTDRDMHFATIIAGPVEPATRKAFVDVLETYFEQKNKETRHESYRASNAPWHKAWIMAPYRKWVLHVWDIEGPPDSWQPTTAGEVRGPARIRGHQRGGDRQLGADSRILREQSDPLHLSEYRPSRRQRVGLLLDLFHPRHGAGSRCRRPATVGRWSDCRADCSGVSVG